MAEELNIFGVFAIDIVLYGIVGIEMLVYRQYKLGKNVDLMWKIVGDE